MVTQCQWSLSLNLYLFIYLIVSIFKYILIVKFVEREIMHTNSPMQIMLFSSFGL
jgi:hypothetical protein